MSRPLMFQTHPWQPFEITMRCQQGRFLLRPGSECNNRIIGVLARAMEVFDGRARLYFAGGTSNHLHVIAAFESAEWKARWKCFVKCNISKELGHLHDWRGCLWERRCRDIAILDDDAFRERLAYLASHAVKDGLVTSPDCWPGIQWVRAVTDGRPLRGVWYDRSALHGMQRRWDRDGRPGGRRPHLMDVAETKTLRLDPPPMWADLSVSELRRMWVELVEYALAKYPPPPAVLGRAGVLAASPHDRPLRSKRSPAPAVHTTCRRLRTAWVEAYGAFVAGYREALRRLRAGWDDAVFPDGGCRPACLLGGRVAGG